MSKPMLVISALTLAITSAASAHVPTVLPRDTPANCAVGVPMPIEKSAAVYATFEYPGDVDSYGFSFSSESFDASLALTDIRGVANRLIVTAPNGKPGRVLHVGSLVPACQIYASVLPTVAIVGPAQDALPAYDGSVAIPAGVELKTGQGVTFLQNPNQGPVWYEEFSYKSYFDQNSADLVVTEQGEYRIYVWDANTNVGDYVLEIGQIEVFGFPEIMQALFWVTHIIYDGEISNNTCKQQLEALDGRNPSVFKVISDYEKMFGK